MEYKVIIGIVAALIALIGYVPYIKNIFSGKTKPHAFSWLIWSLITFISFAAQVSDFAGPGAFATLIFAFACFLIFVFALWKGERNIIFIDWVLLGCALFSLFLWYITQSPFLSIILIVLTDFFGFLPTIRKSYSKPFEETLSTYVLSGAAHAISLLALTHYSVITALYPASLVLTNSIFVLMVMWRRKMLMIH